ncbi:MAG: L,D-transpeptidase family protein [Catenulispora sp.]|nr:L,D-transpeptidase family protein [Catenulispora sp.]
MLATACTSGTKSAAGTSGGGAPVAQGSSTSATPSGGSGDTPPPTAPSSASPPVVTITPAADAADIDPDSQVQVSVANGKLDSVTATLTGGSAIQGQMDATATSWTSSGALGTNKTYSVSVVAENADGAKSTTTSKFTTSKPSAIYRGTYTPDPGAVVGVAQPISINFSKAITDKAAVERGLSVEATPAVKGSWYWYGNQRVDYRPQDFWTPGTKVTLHMHLDGVKSGNAYGDQNRDVAFSISPHAIVATADVAAKTMTVTQDGVVLKKLLISAGKPGFDTWNGTMVVQRKVDDITMDSKTVGIFGTDGYLVKDVRYAVQLTDSGTYVHAAPWNEGKFGRVNGSHGCIGLSLSDAAWFYKTVGLGDPVIVKNSDEKVVRSNNGFADWNISWSAWTAGSALH